MRISNGSERGRFQRAYKYNGSGAGAKLKHTYYCGNPLFFLPKIRILGQLNCLSEGVGVVR